MNPLMSHKWSEHVHARRRANERLKMTFTKRDNDNITELIENGCALYELQQDEERGKYSVYYNNRYLTIIYDKLRKQVVTFYPNLTLRRN